MNAYQAVRTDAYRLTYAEFWEGYRRLFAEGLVVSCSEPVVRAVMGLGDVRSPCGHGSIRFNPRGQVIPCVYWPLDGTQPPTIADLAGPGDVWHAGISGGPLRAARGRRLCVSGRLRQPARAQWRARRGRRLLPVGTRGRNQAGLAPARAKDLMRSGNVCTTVVV